MTVKSPARKGSVYENRGTCFLKRIGKRPWKKFNKKIIWLYEIRVRINVKRYYVHETCQHVKRRPTPVTARKNSTNVLITWTVPRHRGHHDTNSSSSRSGHVGSAPGVDRDTLTSDVLTCLDVPTRSTVDVRRDPADPFVRR